MTNKPPSPKGSHAESFPAHAHPDEQLRFLTRYAVLAPSVRNTQPWHFEVGEGALELWADRTRALQHLDPDDRELTISCGAALYHLRIAARHYGYVCKVERMPDPVTPDLLARVRLYLADAPSEEEERLFKALPDRHTNRRPFADRFVPRYLLRELSEAVEGEGAWLAVLTEPVQKTALASLIREGDQIQQADPLVRDEIAAWMRPVSDPRQDGVSGYALGAPRPLDFATPLLAALVRRFDQGEAIGEHDYVRAEEAGALVVVGTEGDARLVWLRAGEALARMLLRATAAGLSASFFSQPLAVPRLRARLAEVAGRGGYPQVVARLGFGPRVGPAPRRDPNDVLDE